MVRDRINMEKLYKALEILNSMTVTGVDNCTKVAFASQIIRDYIETTMEDIEKGDANGEQHK